MSELKLNGKVVCIKKCEYFTLGKQYKVSFLGEATVILIDDDAEQNEWNLNGFEEYFKVFPTKNQRITALENEVAELKVIVHQLRKPSTDVAEALAIDFEADADVIEFEGAKYKKVDRESLEGDVVIFRVNETEELHSVVNKPYLVVSDDDVPRFTGESGTNYRVYTDDHNRTPETVDVYEFFAYGTPEKSPNELRAEIIEKAKGFVESRINGGEQVIPDGNGGQWFLRSFDFVVNEAKRTIVVLCKSYTGRIVLKREIAKCMPSDVFNSHIGKAIALGRALGLDVSEFEQAVQPTELAIGMKVELLKQLTHPNNSPGSIKIISNPGYYPEGGDTCAIDSVVAKSSKIINDTNAQYGGVE